MFMRRWHVFTLIALCILALSVTPARATPPNSPPREPATNDQGTGEQPLDDISAADEQAMWDAVQHNIAALQSAGRLAIQPAAQQVALAWPLKMAPGTPDLAIYNISAYVDHNAASGAILDYNGGTRTYDGHHGTDIAIGPFPWTKVDAGEVQVVAAAAGTIVVHDNVTAADHNCSGGATGSGGNYIAIQHSDGHISLYAHMRYNSLTSKKIGDAVAQGEYLGTVASSGSSNGPHLHFEIRTSLNASAWVDPFATSPANSLWANQIPYTDSTIKRVSTHSAAAVINTCPPETPNLKDSFTAPTSIYLYIFYRDYLGAYLTVQKVYRPDGSLFKTWPAGNPDSSFYPSLWRSWLLDLPANAPAGTWRYEVSYNNQVVNTYFNVNSPPAISLSSPNGGEQWDVLVPHPITWSDNLGGNVTIALYQNGTIASFIASTASDGEYQWIPGLGVTPGAGYTIRVSNQLNAAVYDESNAPFTLLPSTLTNRGYLPSVMH